VLGLNPNAQCVRRRIGKVFEGTRVRLIDGRALNKVVVVQPASLMSRSWTAPVDLHEWTIEDALFFARHTSDFYGICHIRTRRIVGIVGISAAIVFEVAGSEVYRGPGLALEATLLLLDDVFGRENCPNLIRTLIHQDNTTSLRSALSFGWKLQSGGGDEWEDYTLRREEYLSSIRLDRLRYRLISH
jgi:hypothetical protein